MIPPRARDPVDHKRRLIAESARTRKRLADAVAPMVQFHASARRLAEGGLQRLGQPAALGALALLLAVVGPRRVVRTLRWATLALPLNPVGRRLLSALGSKFLAWLTATRR